MTTPPPPSIKDLSGSQHRPLEKCPVPRVPPSDPGAEDPFPLSKMDPHPGSPYQKWIPTPADQKLVNLSRVPSQGSASRTRRDLWPSREKGPYLDPTARNAERRDRVSTRS